MYLGLLFFRLHDSPEYFLEQSYCFLLLTFTANPNFTVDSICKVNWFSCSSQQPSLQIQPSTETHFGRWLFQSFIHSTWQRLLPKYTYDILCLAGCARGKNSRGRVFVYLRFMSPWRARARMLDRLPPGQQPQTSTTTASRALSWNTWSREVWWDCRLARQPGSSSSAF